MVDKVPYNDSGMYSSASPDSNILSSVKMPSSKSVIVHSGYRPGFFECLVEASQEEWAPAGLHKSSRIVLMLSVL